jgi:hypothetical protein
VPALITISGRKDCTVANAFSAAGSSPMLSQPWRGSRPLQEISNSNSSTTPQNQRKG